jgi:ribosomal protein S15P/S13E
MQEEVIDLSELLRTADYGEESPAQTSPATDRPTETRPAATEPTGQIPPSLNRGLHDIIDELRHLLRYLELIETGITQEGDLKKTALIFRLVRDKALTLTGEMSDLAARARHRDKSLWSTLDTIGFAIKHELRRVYEVENAGLTSPEVTRFSRYDLIRAYGLLQNCFHQSAIALAQILNPTLNGEKLFEEYKIKKEDSLTLHRELTLLLHKVSRVQKEAGLLQIRNVINGLKRFQQDTMHLLMYRDWGEFEEFVDEIVKTYDELGNLQPVLHRFASYLETLLKHVSMRAVLNDKTLIP